MRLNGPTGHSWATWPASAGHPQPVRIRCCSVQRYSFLNPLTLPCESEYSRPAGLRPPAALNPLYCEMLRVALGSAYTYHEFDAKNELLPGPGAADAYVITGSESGVYEPHEWIRRLRHWLVALDRAVPLVGICFGHQIMAQAYGGRVQRSASGWAGGLQEYQVIAPEAWIDESTPFTLPVAHQDHVVVPAPRSRLIATNDRCQYAALSYGDRRAISFQGHPEFPLDGCAMLIDHPTSEADRSGTRGRRGAREPEENG